MTKGTTQAGGYDLLRYQILVNRKDDLFDAINATTSTFSAGHRNLYAGKLVQLISACEALLEGNFDLSDHRQTIVSRQFEIPSMIEAASLLSSQYEYSPYVGVFMKACRELDLFDDSGVIVTYDRSKLALSHPAYRDSPEKCIAKDLATRIIEIAKSENVMAKVHYRAHESQARYIEYCRYLDNIFSSHSKVIVVRTDLYYLPSIAGAVDIRRATDDFDHMLANRRNNQIFRNMLGYVAKLEYGIAKGFHWHVIWMLDGRSRQPLSHSFFGERFGDYWKNVVTHGDGDYWNCNRDYQKYERMKICGIGPIQSSDGRKRENLKNIIAYFCKTGQYLRPKFDRNVRLFRRGLLTRPKVRKSRNLIDSRCS